MFRFVRDAGARILTTVQEVGKSPESSSPVPSEQPPRLAPLAPYLPIERMADGQKATIVGRMQLHDANALVAPLSALPCIYYELGLWNPERNRWRPIVTKSKASHFAIDDGTGQAIVATGALAVWSKTKVSGAGTGRGGPTGSARDRIDDVFQGLAREAGGEFVGRTWISETVLPEGTIVAAWGRYRLEIEGSAYRTAARRTVLLDAPPHGSVWVTDDVVGALSELGICVDVPGT